MVRIPPSYLPSPVGLVDADLAWVPSFAAGFHSVNSGTYLLKCDSVDCCYEGKQKGEPPDVKAWDIFHPDGKWDPVHPTVTYLGERKTTELNNKPVVADAWEEFDHLPFTNKTTGVKYT